MQKGRQQRRGTRRRQTKPKLIDASHQLQDRNLQMPPSGKLSEAQIELIQAWIESGATDPRTQELKNPDHKHGSDTTSPIDRDPNTHWAFQCSNASKCRQGLAF